MCDFHLSFLYIMKVNLQFVHDYCIEYLFYIDRKLKIQLDIHGMLVPIFLAVNVKRFFFVFYFSNLTRKKNLTINE